MTDIYEVPRDKIDVIPHGIPDMPFVDPNFYKDHFGAAGKSVLLTFGLLGPNKAIEVVIKALPAIVRSHPDVVYIVLGATHPNLLRHQGEEYRRGLERLAQQLGVEKHVMFCNRFVEFDELLEYLGAADVYVTPYSNPAQVTSGTLAYAFGCGKAVVSTPYWHAEELLADGRGILVPFGDSEAIAAAVIELLKNETRRHEMRKKAYQLGRSMVWQRTAEDYLQTFARARERCALAVQIPTTARPNSRQQFVLPALNLQHLRTMTDGTGMLQHACQAFPNYAEGYCIDDNARALMFTVQLEELERDDEVVRGFATKYAAFLQAAFNPERKRFRNFMSYNRNWMEEVGSDDSQARAIWALGTCVGRSNRSDLRNWAVKLFNAALEPISELIWPRSCAFALLGIVGYLERFHGDRLAIRICQGLTRRLLDYYVQNRQADWVWFEDSLTYDNARLAQAVIAAGQVTGNSQAVTAGLATLRWLIEMQTNDAGVFCSVGSNGWWRRGGERARFDQQPVDAWATVSACTTAYQATHDDSWLADARNAFQWFLGKNELGLPLYDKHSGGCQDGLRTDRLNVNQGAESTLAFLSARAELERVGIASAELDRLATTKAIDPHSLAIR